jgi:Ca-activated chloride channel family protein
MINVSNIEFEYPWMLVLLALIPLIYWWLNKQGRSWNSFFPVPSAEYGNINSSWKVILFRALPYLKLISLSLIIIAMTGPRLGLKEESVKSDGIDIMIVMDVSTSMLALDFEPNRLEAAKELAKEFISGRKHDRIGLVIFAAEAFTFSPTTIDHQLLYDYIDQIQTDFLKDGTAIGNGVAAAVNRLKDSESNSKVIIMLTDGINNTGYVDPAIATEIARNYGIKIYTIGIGSNDLADFPARNIFGQVVYQKVRVELDEQLLEEMAKATEGYYFRATDTPELREVYEKIDKLEKTRIEVSVFKRYYEQFRMFLIPALILLFLVFLSENTVLRSLP